MRMEICNQQDIDRIFEPLKRKAELATLPNLTDSDDWKALERAASRSIPGDEGVIAKCLLDVREYLNSIVKYLESKE